MSIDLLNNTKKCLICATEFQFKSAKARYCSHYCKHLAYRKRNPEKVKQRRNLWYSKNTLTRSNYRKTMREYHRDYWIRRRTQDLDFKIRNNIRSRLNNIIKNHQKSGSAINDLGCSIQELRQHLESQFTDGMSWENYGEWHIDHIQPLASFNLKNRNEFLTACHYSNLQPLWAKDNLRKGDK